MNHKRPPLPAIIVILLVVVLSAYFLITQTLGKNNGALAASGFIEATQVNVASELAGKVVDVLAAEGGAVRMGDPLLRLDPSLLAAQRAVASAQVDSARNALLTAQSAYALAQAQYDASLAAARAQEGSARLTDWAYRAPSRFDQPLWYFTRAEQITAAQAEVQSASQALQQAQADLDRVVQDLKNADFVKAELRMSEARIGYLIARAVDDHAQATGGDVNPEDIKLPPYISSYRLKIEIAKTLSSDSDILTVSQDALDAAEAELTEAQRAYDDLLTTDAAERVLSARAALSVAGERYEVALDTWSRMQTGENSPQVKIAAAALEQSKAVMGQAESAVRQAEANLALLDTQVAKLTVASPMDGVVLTRSVEPGEFLQPGTPAFILGELSNLTITVYVPEDRFGQIKIGQTATVSVDSFPGVTFTATVIQVADKAEFTPRNVQTVEGRRPLQHRLRHQVECGQSRGSTQDRDAGGCGVQ